MPDTSWESANTLSVTLENNATWIVTDTSNLTSLTISEGSEVKGSRRHKVIMTVDGQETKIEPGTTYTGDISLTSTTW
jgi:hypothetical protein